jgi:hypothetical protein
MLKPNYQDKVKLFMEKNTFFLDERKLPNNNNISLKKYYMYSLVLPGHLFLAQEEKREKEQHLETLCAKL